MVQPRVSPLSFNGPWLGINERTDERRLFPGYAVEAHNVLLGDGRIRPAVPWYPFGDAQGQHDLGNGRIVAVIQRQQGASRYVVGKFIYRPDPQQTTHWLGGLFRAAYDVPRLVVIYQGLRASPARFIIANGWTYVIDGGERLYKVRPDGFEARAVGILPPKMDFPDDPIHDFGPVPVNGLDLPTRSYAVTYVDAETGVESNATIGFTWPAITNRGHRFNLDHAVPGGHGISHVRIYRKNHDLGQPFFRLILEQAAPQTDPPAAIGLFDFFTEDAITASDTIVGPFAPSRNGLPPAGAVEACWHDERMFYAAEPGRVQYSEVGIPDHVAANDFLNVTGDGDDTVTGLASDAGQLVIGKRGGPWILSGTIGGADNLTVALGDVPEESTHELYRSRAKVGPISGFVRAGTPSRLMFGAVDGVFAFDSGDAVPVAQVIPELWGKFVRRGSGTHLKAFIEYVDDPADQVLYLCNAALSEDERGEGGGYVAGPEILALHYGLSTEGASTPGWASLAAGSTRDAGQVRAIGPAIGDDVVLHSVLSEGAGQAVMLVAVLGALKLASATRHLLFLASQLPAVRPWRWRTGQLAPAPGLRKHFYRVKWLTARPGADTRGVFVVALQALIDAGTTVTPEHLVELDGRVRIVQRVSVTGEDIALQVRADPRFEEGESWSRDLGILGFELDYELSGA